MKTTARKHLAYSVKSAKYGPVETENDRVGTVDAQEPEAKEDDWGATALKRKRKKGGRVEGKKPRVRMDRAKHPDEAEDKRLIRKMVKSSDLKPERARGGPVKGKKGTTVNVVIAPQGGGAPGGMPPMPPRPPMPMGPPPGAGGPPPGAGAGGPPPPMAPPPRPGMAFGGAPVAPVQGGGMRPTASYQGGVAPPPGGPGIHGNYGAPTMGGVPPVQGAPIQQGGGVMTPVGGQNPGGMQPMGWRAKGGRIGYPLKDGSGGGEGRLEKIRAYGAKAKETEKK